MRDKPSVDRRTMGPHDRRYRSKAAEKRLMVIYVSAFFVVVLAIMATIYAGHLKLADTVAVSIDKLGKQMQQQSCEELE